MAEPTVLPLDVIQNIVDILVDDAEGLQYVKAVSLTCKSFLPFCRKHIFSSIEITTRMWPELRPPTSEILKQLLETPAIVKYVRHLAICISFHPNTEFEYLAQVAQRLMGIQSLTVWFCSHSTGHSDWNDIPLSTRRSLLTLMHLPTLTRLSLRTINNFPISNLITCTNIKHLSAEDIHISDVEHDEAASTLHKTVQLQTLRLEIGDPTRARWLAARCPNGRPALDFTGLEKLSIFFYPGWTNADVPAREIFRKAQELVDITLEADDNTFRALELAKMVTPSLQTLRRLSLTIFFCIHGPDPLAVICDEFEQISGKNNLESIDIEVELNTDEDFWKGGEWGRLEKALNQSGWPMLKHISLFITTYSSFRIRVGGPFGMALKSLPQTHFTDFTSRKGLDFQFSVKEV